jgi:peptidoglycan/xylan/chitin deacetylase (PgdA/CDA1 family)
MRPDRIITLNVVQPCRRVAFRFKSLTSHEPSLGQCLPILMYHSIADEPEENVSPYYRTVTSPESFAAHLGWLRAEGYEVLGLQAGLEKFQRGNSATAKLAVITFDDGFRDFYTAALPVLRQHQCGATVFLPTAFIGQERRRFKDRECMIWDEVRESQRSGIEFGSHTVNHPKLYELDLPRLRAELKESKTAIEAELGRPARSFAYPYAFPSADHSFVKVFVGLLKETGYDCNVTTKIGLAARNDDLFTLKRLPMNSADDGALFRAKLDGDYEWLAWPQETFKKMRSLVSNGRSGLAASRVPVKSI